MATEKYYTAHLIYDRKPKIFFSDEWAKLNPALEIKDEKVRIIAQKVAKDYHKLLFAIGKL